MRVSKIHRSLLIPQISNGSNGDSDRLSHVPSEDFKRVQRNLIVIGLRAGSTDMARSEPWRRGGGDHSHTAADPPLSPSPCEHRAAGKYLKISCTLNQIEMY